MDFWMSVGAFLLLFSVVTSSPYRRPPPPTVQAVAEDTESSRQQHHHHHQYGGGFLKKSDQPQQQEYPVKKYDQRQDGELNIQAHLDKIVLLIIPSKQMNLLDYSIKGQFEHLEDFTSLLSKEQPLNEVKFKQDEMKMISMKDNDNRNNNNNNNNNSNKAIFNISPPSKDLQQSKDNVVVVSGEGGTGVVKELSNKENNKENNNNNINNLLLKQSQQPQQQAKDNLRDRIEPKISATSSASPSQQKQDSKQESSSPIKTEKKSNEIPVIIQNMAKKVDTDAIKIVTASEMAAIQRKATAKSDVSGGVRSYQVVQSNQSGDKIVAAISQTSNGETSSSSTTSSNKEDKSQQQPLKHEKTIDMRKE